MKKRNIKQCMKCGEVKSLSEFYKHSKMADGHINKCKVCTRSDVRSNRRKNIEYYRDYDRKRGNRQGLEYLQSYRRSNPIKYGAHCIVNNAIASGKIKKPDRCEDCGSDKYIHGHHEDYAKPLEVRWLCASCHRQWHIENGEAKNAK